MKELDGFTEFVGSRLPALIRLGYLLTGDHQHGEDLVQTALMKTALHWKRVTDPSAYTRRVMVHENISWWRRRRFREQSLDAGMDRASGEDTAETVTRRELFVVALRRLTARQRAVIVLRYYEDLSEADTALALGCAVGTVKSRTHHALARLRELSPELAALAPELSTSEVA